MTTIKIDYTAGKDAVARVEKLLEETAIYNPNWSGAQFKIERDEFTCVEGGDEYAAASLLYAVQHAIADEV